MRRTWNTDAAGDVGTHRLTLEVTQIGGDSTLTATVPFTLVGETARVFGVSSAPAPARVGEGLTVRYQLAVASSVVIDVYGIDGRRIAHETRAKQFSDDPTTGSVAGENFVTLAANTGGAPLAPGVYVVHVEALEGGANSVATGTIAVRP